MTMKPPRPDNVAVDHSRAFGGGPIKDTDFETSSGEVINNSRWREGQGGDCPRPLGLFFEPRGFFGAFGRVAFAVGVRAHACELAALQDEIFVADGAFLEPAFEDFARAGRVT